MSLSTPSSAATLSSSFTVTLLNITSLLASVSALAGEISESRTTTNPIATMQTPPIRCMEIIRFRITLAATVLKINSNPLISISAVEAGTYTREAHRMAELMRLNMPGTAGLRGGGMAWMQDTAEAVSISSVMPVREPDRCRLGGGIAEDCFAGGDVGKSFSPFFFSSSPSSSRAAS